MEARAHRRWVIDVTHSVDSAKFTGVERMVRGLVAALGESGVIIVPVVWNGWRRGWRTLLPEEQQRLASLAPATSPTRKPEGSPLHLGLRRLLRPLQSAGRAFAPEPDDMWLFPEPMADPRATAMQTSGRKAWAICHDVIPWEEAIENKTAVSEPFVNYLRRLAQMDRVICISRRTQTALLEAWNTQGITPAPTEVLPWPVPFRGPRPGGDTPPESGRILCVGSLSPRKNHAVLIASLRLLGNVPGLRVVVVGREGKHGAPIARALREAGQEGLPLSWLAHLGEDELHREYARCSFTVLPSLREGFGLPVLESLWHRRPCLCHHQGATAETAEAGGCLTVDMTSPAALAAGIRSMLEGRADELRAGCAQLQFARWPDWVRDFDISRADHKPRAASQD